MKRLYLLCLAGALAVPFASVYAQEFPAAPPNLKEIKAKGLPRLSTEELKALFPDVVNFKGSTGQHKMTFKSDGLVVMTTDKQDMTGKWRIDEKNNAYCMAFNFKKGYAEYCFAVFRASDGTHYFDYDIKNGFYARTWRQSTE